MDTMKIKQLSFIYYDDYKHLIKKLWKDIDDETIEKEIKNHLDKKTKIYVAILNEKAIGFINLSIRNDHVEGSHNDVVGYIEGIYIEDEYRNRNIARKLIDIAMIYFKSNNINEIGSDTLIDNELSQLFHESIGFTEVNTVKHYILKIED